MKSLHLFGFFFVLFNALYVFPAYADIRAIFYKLPTNDSIADTNSFCVFQDSRGILWVCTTNGLAQYNSSEVTIYRNNPNEKDSLPSNIIRDIAESDGNMIWLATINGGLVSFDPKSKIFTQYDKDIDTQLWSITLDHNGKTLWLGSLRYGLSSFDIETKTSTRYPLVYPDGSEITRINDIFQLNAGLLLGTDKGLYLFNPGKSKVVTVISQSVADDVWDIERIDSDTIWVATDNGLFNLNGDPIPAFHGYKNLGSIDTGNNGNIYLATRNNGILVFDKNSGEIIHITYSKSYENPLPDNRVWDIEITKDNMVFVATKNGAASFNPQAMHYTYYDLSHLGQNISDNLSLYSIFVDKSNTLWAGTSIGPLNLRRDTDGNYKVNQFTIINSIPYDFAEDSQGTIWMADYNLGLILFGKKNRMGFSPASVPTKHFKCCNSLTSLLLNSNGTLWVGSNESGIARYVPADRSYTDISMQNIGVSVVTRFDQDNLLVGSYGGLYLFNTKSKDYNLVKNTERYFIFDIWHAQSGVFYIGTDKGLLRIADTGNAILSAEQVNVFNGRNRVIFSILEAGNGDLWLGTGIALARYRPSTGKAYLLTPEQGVPIEGFMRNSATKSKTDSQLYFGGPSGAISFNPELIRIDNTMPSVFISDINAQLTNSINHLSVNKDIKIPFNLKTLHLQFYSLDYQSPATPPYYAYALIGFDNELSYTHSNYVSFTNLDPGTYTFKIKAANSFGEWGDEFTELTFTVLTPWWMRWWAYTLYTILAIAVLSLVFWYQHRRLVKERNISTQLREAESLREHFVQELEGQVSSATSDLRDSMEALQIKTVELEVANKRAQDSTQLKSQFLANISHELRTPMNGILGFVDLLNRTKLEDKQRDYVNTIRRSSESLVDIINNVLDISKIEAGKITLDVTGFNLRDCIESTLSLLAPIAYDKQLELCCIIEPDLPAQLRGDPARLRQILINLLGNAIKFTQAGTVSIRVMAAPGQKSNNHKSNSKDDTINLTIAISDTGIGVAPDHMERLFTSFSQATPGIERRYGGTGLGLSLSKMLVKAMQGEIDLQSTPNVGTTVKIDLPFIQDAGSHDWQVDEKLAGNTILLYDEHPLCTQGFVFLLQSWGMQVIETSNADEWHAELERHSRQPRYAAFVIALGTRQTGKAKKIIKGLCGKQANLPLLVMASTLDLNILYRLETGIGAPCLARHAGSRMIHNTLLTLLDDQSQFIRTARRFSENTALAGLRVLIADDNTANRELLRHMLRQNGAHTAETADGRETLDRLRAMDGADNKPWDLLLLDIHMPNVSGLEVIARIRDDKAGSPTLPVIAVTANAMPEMRQWAVACGMDGYIIKPFTEEKLLEEIKHVLSSRTDENDG